MIAAVITGDPPPVAGISPNGAGLRAHGITTALRELGHDARLLFPAEHLPEPAARLPVPAWVRPLPRATLLRLEFGLPAEAALIFQHWGLLAEALALREALPQPAPLPPIAIDLAGPHLLERAYWGHPAGGDSLAQKRRALAAACAVFIASRRQAAWFAPFLVEAWADHPEAERATLAALAAAMEGGAAPSCRAPGGRTIGRAAFHLGPPPLLPPPPAGPPARRPRLVVAGAFLPWQDPSWSIGATLGHLEQRGCGELLVIGSELPFVAGGEAAAALQRLLGRHPRARRLGRLAFEEVVAHLRAADAVLDVMAPNPERLLASPTRTAVARWLDVPLLYNDYDEDAAAWRGTEPERTGRVALIPHGDVAALGRSLDAVLERSRRAGGAAPPVAPRLDAHGEAHRSAGDIAAWLDALAPRGGNVPALPPTADRPAGRLGPPLDLSRRSAIAEAAARELGLGEDVVGALREGLERVAAWAATAPVGRDAPHGGSPSSRRRLRRLVAASASPAAALAAFAVAIRVGRGVAGPPPAA